MKNIKTFYLKYTLVFLLFVCCLPKPGFSYNGDDKKNKTEFETLTIEGGTIAEADNSLRSYLIDLYPLLTDKIINGIIEKRSIQPIWASSPGETEKIISYSVNYKVPKNFLADTVKIFWELNIPEFRSNLYQLYNGDTIYIDTWNNVVGTIQNKTYTGSYFAYRIKNWPSWKDPEKGKEELPAVPPGPKNPLGLFVVYYDLRSLRYFHGSNKNYLLDDKFRSLSHGCVRNDNGNIEKMKEFIIKRVVKAKDLTAWLNSKSTIVYDFEEFEKFPVSIIYKTYNVNRDEGGVYFEVYKDVYNYTRAKIDESWNDANLISLTSKENIMKEYRKKVGNDLSDEKLGAVADYMANSAADYEKYYLSDLLAK